MSFLDAVIHQIREWDRKISLGINGKGGKFLTYGLQVISFLGRETIWLLLLIFYTFIWLDPLMLINIGWAYLIGIFIIVPMKMGIDRERPFREVDEIRVLGRIPSSGSFPSWHSYNIVSQGIVFLYMFPSPLLLAISLVLVMIVCFSRVQLGVHYPSDVIMGILIGIAGGVMTVVFVSPFFLRLFYAIQDINPELFYNTLYTINPLIFRSILYLALCILLMGLVLLLGCYKYLKKILDKK